jgi:hypothetical protein
MGREKAPINQASYNAYVARLKKEGKGFPMNNKGDVRWTQSVGQPDGVPKL